MAAHQENLMSFGTDSDIDTHPVPDPNPPACTTNATAPDQAHILGPSRSAAVQDPAVSSQGTSSAMPEVFHNPERPGLPIVKVEEPEEGQLTGDTTLVQPPPVKAMDRGSKPSPAFVPTWGPDARLARMESSSAAREQKGTDGKNTRTTEVINLERSVKTALAVYGTDFMDLEIDESETSKANNSKALIADKSASPTDNISSPPKYTVPYEEGSLSDLENDKTMVLVSLERYMSHYEDVSKLLDIDTESLSIGEIKERLKELTEWLTKSIDLQCLGRDFIVQALDRHKRRMEWLESLKGLDEDDDEEGSGKGKGRARNACEELRCKVEELRRRLGDFEMEHSMYRIFKSVGDTGGYRAMMGDYMRLRDEVQHMLLQRDALAAENLDLEEESVRAEAEKEEGEEKLKNEVADLKQDLDASLKQVFHQVYLIGELDGKVKKLEDENKTLKGKVGEIEYLELKERHQTDWAKKELWEDLYRENALLKDKAINVQQLREDKEMLQAKNLTLEAEMERLERRNSELLVQVSGGGQERRKEVEAKSRKGTFSSWQALEVSGGNVLNAGGLRKDEGKPATKEDTPQSPTREDDSLAGEDIYDASPSAEKERFFW